MCKRVGSEKSGSQAPKLFLVFLGKGYNQRFIVIYWGVGA